MKQVSSLKLTIGLILGMFVGVMCVTPRSAFAEGLQIRPLLYKETLKAGEAKKGFVDVSNASDSPVIVDLSVEGFKQVNNSGDLQFFPSQAIAGGVLLDLKKVSLGPKEAVRVYFLIDNKKLPAGDVLAAIFATTQPADQGAGIATAARVGTLLVINNGGGLYQASVMNLRLPWFIFGENIQGTVDVKNSASPQQTSAFFPTITVNVGPVAPVSQKITGSLISGDITRKVSFNVPTNRLGFYKVSVSADGGASVSQWAFVITGRWRIVFLIVIGLVLVGIGWTVTRKRRHLVSRQHGQ